jgi:sterol desaturase/sphingolipid hydroxylase (fatty acid hydroxylase superfamily)
VGVRLPLRSLPAPVAVPVAIAAYDLFHASFHRLFHEWGPGWTIHAVHHSPKRLYWFNAMRFHAVETLIDTVVETMIGAVLPLSADQQVGYVIMRGTYGQFQHCNIALDSGPLNRVFSTPDLHRWHHSVVYAEGDTNYGAITSVWDQLFGSYFHPDRPLESEMGVGRMPEFPTSWRQLQLVPLQWARIKQRNAATWYEEAPAA